MKKLISILCFLFAILTGIYAISTLSTEPISEALINFLFPMSLAVIGIRILRKIVPPFVNGKHLASFGDRLVSVLIDGLIFGLPNILIWIFSKDLELYLIVYVNAIFWFIYYFIVVWFHTKFGKTPGKFVAKIKVIKEDGANLNAKDAFSRSSLEILFAIPMSIGQIFMFYLFQKSGQEYQSYWEYLLWSGKQNGNWVHLMGTISGFYSYSEIWFIMLNDKKKAIHDYLSDTIVIKDI